MNRAELLKALRDTAQSASNAIASNVSGPVDLIAAALRAGGLDIQQPVGGSEWMQKKGLTAPVEQGAPQVIGETLGMVGPALATQFAPQIANGLLKVGENAAIPAQMNSQAGAINVKALQEAFPEIDFSLLQRGDRATLSKVVVPKELRGSGRGTEFMNELTRLADEDAAKLALSPSSDFGGSKARLEQFYRRFGFVPNKGRTRDFEIMESMYREPR